MNFLIYFLQKTVGQKIVVGLTGVGLFLFILIHMLGNLFILSGPSAYNKYAHSLHNFPALKFFEIGLLIFFAGHIILSFLIQIKNNKARGDSSYQLKAEGIKKISWVHQFLWFQGAVLLIFLIFHLWSFKFGPYYETSLNGEPARDIYKLVSEGFKNPFYTISYSLALLILSVHLFRGLPASFKSLGFSHSFLLSLVEKLSIFFSVFITLGFLAPIWYIFIYNL